MSIINVGSPSWEIAESYGRYALEITSQFERQGYTVNRFGLNKIPGGIIKPTFGGLLFGYPTLFERFGASFDYGPVVAMTAFESSVLPEGWVDNLNSCAASVVPSRWVKEVFLANGVTSPVEVVPHGISDVFMNVKRREYSEPFTFIAFADRGYRKGWWQAAQAFTSAFGKDMRYKLIIKSRGGVLKNITNPNIEVITDSYTDEQLVELYHRCHVMIAANCAEGFGFLPREFAATGGISLATNWGGTADELQWWGLPVAYSLSSAWCDDQEWNGRMGEWAEPDVDGLTVLLKHIANNFSSYADFGVRAAGFVASHYRWSRAGKQISQIWSKYASDISRNLSLPA